jgi:hypothetical protein
MTNGNRQEFTLVRHAGPDNFRMLSLAVSQLQILAACMQDSPILLKSLDFNLLSAKTDAFKVGLENERKIWQLAWQDICASLLRRSAVHAGVIGKIQGILCQWVLPGGNGSGRRQRGGD